MAKPKVENESKQEKFKRIASARTQRILDGLRLLGNCSGKGGYDYSEEDVRKIFSTIDSELKRVKQLFNDQDKNKKFRL